MKPTFSLPLKIFLGEKGGTKSPEVLNIAVILPDISYFISLHQSFWKLRTIIRWFNVSFTRNWNKWKPSGLKGLNILLCFKCQTFLEVCGSWQLQTSDWKPHLLLHSFQSRMFTVAHCQQQYTFFSHLLYIINLRRDPSR